MSSFVESKMSSKDVHFQYCDFLNISMCEITETEKSFILNVYNPIGRSVSTFVRLPVNSRSFTVKDSKGEPVDVEVVSTTAETLRLRPLSTGYASFELVFEVTAPALGFANYFISQTNQQRNNPVKKRRELVRKRIKNEDLFIENEQIRLDFSPGTGRLTKMTQKIKDLSLKVDQQFFWYNGSQGNDISRQTSGAYIFRPNRSEPYPMTNGNKATIEIVKGALVQEVRQSFGPIVSQVIRLYKGEPYAEFEYTVGPIPVSDHLGKEIITRFDTKIENGGKFYTDANGREMKERIRNHRDTWKLNVSEPVSGNYYPINSRIFINDTKSQLTVMTDRSQGGSSINDGQLEIMLHRRLLKDDFLGVGEPLNEPGMDGKGLVTRGKHRVLLSTPKDGYHLHREQGELMMLPPILR